MSRLNTKQRRARFRNSETGKYASRLILGASTKRHFAHWVKRITSIFPLLRGVSGIPE